jgi:hypothetical protein
MMTSFGHISHYSFFFSSTSILYRLSIDAAQSLTLFLISPVSVFSEGAVNLDILIF